MPVWAKPLPSQERLLELFIYDPESGELRWRMRGRKHPAGELVGSPTADYRIVRLNRQNYKLHRIIWKMITGEDPPVLIDHVDRNPRNNRWSNLRLASQAENVWNSKIRRTNTSGYQGVCPRYRRWHARIRINGKEVHLGFFPSREEAAQAYEDAKKTSRGYFLGS